MNHISQGQISPLPLTTNIKVKNYEAYSWLMLIDFDTEQENLPGFRMKDNLFSI